jgi:hypothetical protein
MCMINVTGTGSTRTTMRRADIWTSALSIASLSCGRNTPPTGSKPHGQSNDDLTA